MDDSGWKQTRRSGSQMWNIFWIGEIFELTVSGKNNNSKHEKIIFPFFQYTMVLVFTTGFMILTVAATGLLLMIR